MRWEGSINVTRTERLLALAPTIMPDCDIAASKEDVAQFYVFWRSVVREEIEQRVARGQPLDNSDEEEKQRARMKPLGARLIRQYQLPALANIGPEMPHADEAVAHQIAIWKALHCVVEKYGAEKFFTNNGYSDMGMEWPYNTILSEFGYDIVPIDLEKTKAYLLPKMMDVEPLDALGRFFREAEAKGALTFPSEDAEKYFFQRYESNYFYDMKDAPKARSWFHSPPWKLDAPHLERPTRPQPPLPHRNPTPFD